MIKKFKRYPSTILNVAIAIFAMLLGGMITLRAVPKVVAHRVGSFALSFPGIGTIVGLALVVMGLVILKSMVDRRFILDRDLLEAFLEHIPDNVYFKDRKSRFMRISRAMAKYFGLENPAQAENKTDADMFSSEHASKALEDEQEVLRTGQQIVGIEEKETWPDGRESWVLTTKVPLRDHRGQIIGTMGISHNITDRKQAEARIRYMAHHDALTGLPNRVLLTDRLAQAIALAHRNQQRVAVLMLDLDRFKFINDSYGHCAGDRLLEAVSMRLKGCLRESDIIARWGGDEFVIGLPTADDNQGIELVAQKVLAALTEPFQIESQEMRINASIGICQYPPDGETPEALLQIADAAMYEAKKNGRGTYSFFTPELTQATRRRQKLECDLHQACARGEFVLYYQPLVSIESNRITAVEALLRWRHPELGLIFPNEFIPLLEELGLMVDVGAWVLRTACLQEIAWQNEGLPVIRVAVNLSAHQFYRGNIVNLVETVLRETGLDPKSLELEITESLTLEDSEKSIAIMHDLKQIGVNLSLDDFGTGWSSLSYLRRFPLDRIKIDRSFLRDIESQSAAEAVVRSILNLGRNLGLSCVAEGVETREQLAYLHNQMCAEMQGFLYSPALPAEDCGALMRSGKPGI
ncbi:MAG: EAL domain-containing protein [Terracidiphilus sp.]|nr:EAL domain-containing protein [Terracidiphilus sp.]